jgi:phosphoserine phosphatase RsbU/P
MADPRDQQDPPRLVGYESWLYQMPCLGSDGDVFLCVPIEDTPDEPPKRWLIALGDVSGSRAVASRLKADIEAELVRLVNPESQPGEFLEALNCGLMDLVGEASFASMVAAVIDGERHELSVANAGASPLLLRRSNGRVEDLTEEVCGLPLWVVREQTYETVTVPVVPGDVVVFFSTGVTAISDDEDTLFDMDSLIEAITQAPSGVGSVGLWVLEAIRRFAGGRPHPFDMTLLCLGRTT